MNTLHGTRKADHLNICDLPYDVLILIFSSLHAQDFARCTIVCHSFADVIYSDLSLQYKIELAQNGMVDGESSTLAVSEKLQRLRQYSSNFKCGAFQHEDLTAHPDYVLHQANLGWPDPVFASEEPSGALHRHILTGFGSGSPLYLSLMVPGSTQGGIPSSHSIYYVRDEIIPDLVVNKWATDEVQDLFVMVGLTRGQRPPDVIPDFYICLYSLSDVKMDKMTSHPHATQPFIHLPIVGSANTASVLDVHIVGRYIMSKMGVNSGAVYTYFIDISDWKTCQTVSRLDFGEVFVSFVPLNEPYLLVFPSMGMTNATHMDLRVYSFLPLSSNRSLRERHVCTLKLPPAPFGERITWSKAWSGDRAEETRGHFRADSSRSIVVLHLRLGDPQTNEDAAGYEEPEYEYEYEYDTYLLIPRTTLAAHIHAAESTRRRTQRGRGDASPRSATENSDAVPDRPEPTSPSVPWTEWGPRGCLRLCLRSPRFPSRSRILMTPFGSRMPVVAFDGPQNKNASVYVFDVNPLVVRSRNSLRVDAARGHQEHAIDSDIDGLGTGGLAVVEDFEKVLPGVMDPECAAIPYVVYRFPLPVPSPPVGSRGPRIWSVAMSMTGFTVKFDESIEYEKRTQTGRSEADMEDEDEAGRGAGGAHCARAESTQV